jgi:hypothetical protein
VTAEQEESFAHIRRQVRKRREEVAARIAALRVRRIELAAGGPSTPPDVDRAAAAAERSRQCAQEAHWRAAAGYRAAADAHDRAADASGGDVAAHRRAAEEDRQQAAAHGEAASEV